MTARSLVWLGVRTIAFDAMVRLYRDGFGVAVIHEVPTAVWFRMGDGNEVHVYA